MKIIKMLVLLSVFVISASAPLRAADHSESWCADAVDFALRTAQYRALGRTQDATLTSIQHDDMVFQQQYPDLPNADMQSIARRVYSKGWTHFQAAAETSKSCPSTATEAEVPSVLATTDHSDEWCADALDLAMGVAQNRELQFSEPVIAGSFDQNPTYYHMQYPNLSHKDMVDITGTVYQREWTRFGAAAAVGAFCKVQPSARVHAALPIPLNTY